MPTAKRRILFLITSSDWGGAQFFVHALATEAMRKGYLVDIAAGGDGELFKKCAESGIPTHQLTSLRRAISPWHELAALHEIRQLIKTLKPDIVHLNSSKISVIGSLAAHLEHVDRTIYRIGGWSFLESVSPLKRWIYRKSEQLSAGWKDVIVTLHPGDAHEAKRHHITPRRRLVTIPNGIDLTSFDLKLEPRTRARKLLHLPQDAFIIGTIANFYGPKNLAWYLPILSRALETHATAIGVIIGDGPERDAITAIHSQLTNRDRIILAGRRDATPLLHAFDAFVLPSSKEGMPWALLEAMSARLPCIATDVGACRWMLEPDAGIIVPAGSERKLRDAIHTIMHHPDLRTAYGTHARHLVETRFRWEETLQKSLCLFE